MTRELEAQELGTRQAGMQNTSVSVQTLNAASTVTPRPGRHEQPAVMLERDEITLEDGLNREWLVTNGIGGYGMSSLFGGRTRHYHGLLVAATEPPTGRRVLVAQMIERITWPDGSSRHLHVQEWGGGTVDPRGDQFLESFTLEGTIPTWQYQVMDARLEKRIWMKHGHNTSFVTYTLTAGQAVTLELKPLCTHRDHHAGSKVGEAPRVDALHDGLEVRFPGAEPYFIRANQGEHFDGGDWWTNEFLRVEAERGFDAIEDFYRAGRLTARLEPGQTLALVLSTEANAPATDWQAELEAERRRATTLLERTNLAAEPAWVQQLVLAADQFIVSRGEGDTVIAGYPWFGDWGRDTMIALPGLALTTRRPELARSLLRTFGRFVDRGMIPNRFPDAGETPEYNTVDATLLYVQALREYVQATNDESLVDELWVTLEAIVRWHLTGTRYGIRVDPTDGLLRAGEPGVQLTWMDAKIGDWVVTPRTGKPVEINALWYSALRTLQGWAASRKAAHDYRSLADRVADAFTRYWNKSTNYLYDVLDGPDGDDPSIRPNAVIAASLEPSPLEHAWCKAVVDVATEQLLTPYGLRSLAPDDTRYAHRYIGSPLERDRVYHQGPVWPWLLGPFVKAHLRAYGHPMAARAFLEPMAEHIRQGGLGSISEILDGDAPHTPRGCPWQAWSVAEVLHAWTLVAPRPRRDRREP
jgi:predicted glycogen debranching enzyme